jgi:hypothetical protein
MSANEIFRDLPFPFPDDVFPEQLGAVIQRTVLTGEEPGRLVIHTEGNGWLVGDGINDPPRLPSPTRGSRRPVARRAVLVR